jgi:dihydroorotase
LFELHGKGRITAGADADLTLVDLNAKRVITDDWIASKVGWTPYDGMTVSGWPAMTIVNGQIVMRDDEILGRPAISPLTA